MARRFRINGRLLIGLLAVGIGFAAYVTWPLLTGAATDTALPRGFAEVIRERGITAVTGLWFFIFGATIGSFLNVVAYRMPMGLTIISKPSRCPYCETPIRFKHNMPIFGWLALRGRCNACRLPISIRYPLVEVIVGTLFFVLFICELATGGANVPTEFRNARSGIMWNVLSPNWQLIGLYFFHTYVIGLLSTVALIKFDRLRIPIKLVVFSMALAIGCYAIFPSLSIQAWQPGAEKMEQTTMWQRAAFPVAGLIVGSLVGWAMHHIVEPTVWQNSSRTGILTIAAIVGVFLGWQVVVPIVFATQIIQFFTMLGGKLFNKKTDQLWAASSLWATTCVICLWKQLPLLGLPSHASSVWTHWLWLCVAMAIGFVVVHFSTREDTDQPTHATRVSSTNADA